MMHSLCHVALLFLLFALSTTTAFQVAVTTSCRALSKTQLNTATTLSDGGASNVDNNDGSTSLTSQTVDWDWEQLAKDVFVDDSRPIVLFDGVCNLCNGGVNFAMDHDESAKFRFCSLHSRVAKSLLLQAGRSIENPNNIALIFAEEAYFASDAVTRICQQLDAPPLQMMGHLGQSMPNWMREPLFDMISTHRYKFGENDSCRLDFDGTYTSRFVSDPTEF